MPDAVTSTPVTQGGDYTPAPAGPCLIVCVDVIDMGVKADTWQGKPKLSPKVRFVWQTDEVNPATGKPFEVNREFTNSMFKNSNLRKFLGDMRGKSYSDEECEKAIDFTKLVGVCSQGVVEHVKTRNDRTFAKLIVATPLGKGMQKLEAKPYERDPYWAELKAQRAQEVAAAQRAPAGTDEDFPAALADDDDDGLPF